MATISNQYKPVVPITSTNPGILGLKNKVQIPTSGLNKGYVTPVPRTQQQAPQAPMPTPQSVQSVNQPFQPIVDIAAPNKGLFPSVKESIKKPEQNPLTFNSIVGDVRGASNPSSTQSGYVRKIEKIGSQNQALGQKAEDLSTKYGQEIARIGELGAGAVAGNLSTGTNVVGAGNAAIASQSASSRMNALAQGQNAELSGIDKQLAANAAERAALEASLAGSQFQQSTQLGGLGKAGDLAAPSGNYPFTFDPLTGSFGDSSGSGSQMNAEQVAQNLVGGKMTYQQAQAALSYLGPVAESRLNAAITAAGGNALQLQAQGAAQQSNINSGITTPANTAAAGYSDAVQSYNSLGAINNSADAQASQVKTILDSTGLNSSNLNDYTKAINKLGSRIGNEKVTQLTTAMIELQNFYSQLLNTGGITPTGSETAALNTLNPNSSAKQIMASIGELQTAAYNRLNSAYGLIGQYQQNLGGGGQSYGGGGGSSGGGLYSF